MCSLLLIAIRGKIAGMNHEKIDHEKRAFLTSVTKAVAGLGVAGFFIPFISSWFPSSKKSLADARKRINVAALQPGEYLVTPWQNKPIYVVRRSADMLKQLTADEALLRDPLSLVAQQPTYAQNRYRSLNPEYLVLVGICTHLGCTPNVLSDLNDKIPEGQPGFFCPCHGSTFDMAGRVFKGVPAPINLEIPPYRFINSATIEIGE